MSGVAGDEGKVRFRAIPYRIPFVRPLVTARGVWEERCGFWIVAQDEAGRIGLGEAAPLPEHGTEDLEEAERRLQVYSGGAWLSETDWIDGPRRDDPPAVRAGLELAFLDIAAQREGVAVAALLLYESGGEEIRPWVACNALLGQTDPAASAEEGAVAVAAGYGTLKVKAGGRDWKEDVSRIAMLRERVGPDIRIRADANGAWDMETAVRALKELEPYGLEYVEQPVSGDLAGLTRRTKVPIAADESANSFEAALSVIERRAADLLVLKPMAIGGLRDAARLAARARAGGIGVVVTSILDTAVGVTGALHLAAALPETTPACGLATLDRLGENAALGLESPVRGRMAVPAGPGLGVRLKGVNA